MARLVQEFYGDEGQILIKSTMVVFARHRPAGLGHRIRQTGKDPGFFAWRRVLSFVANPPRASHPKLSIKTPD